MATAACPIDPTRDGRKTDVAFRAHHVYKPGAEIVREVDGVKAILRSPELLQDLPQAEAMRSMNPDEVPLIFLDGKLHRERRKQITDFFSPRTVRERFEPLMTATADVLVRDLERNKTMRVDEASWQMAVTLAGDLIGITRDGDRAAMKRTAKRIERVLYRTRLGTRTGLGGLVDKLKAGLYTLDFYLRDVLPTVRARRKAPQDDVISHLVAQNYSMQAILIDAMTLAGAGMQTSREFISLCAWHMLEDEALRQRFVGEDHEGQLAIMEEILRLEPIATTLYRRAPETLSDKARRSFEPGKSYGVDIRAANTDEAAVGACPFAVDPDRKARQGEQGAFLSFGNGMHRCPGAPLALGETRALMDRLMRVPGIRLVSKPKVTWLTHLGTFEISDVTVVCD